MANTRHYQIKVEGRVQGVFFRKSTQQKARELNIYGFVRNEPDGSVYIEAEGEKTQLDKFMEWAQRGPSQANVENFQKKEGDLKAYNSFEVRH